MTTGLQDNCLRENINHITCGEPVTHEETAISRLKSGIKGQGVQKVVENGKKARTQTKPNFVRSTGISVKV